MNNRKTGFDQESAASKFLQEKGYIILARNEHNRFGEIDIICISPDKCLVFTEVKFRTGMAAGDPLEAVDARKIHKICKASAFYMGKHPELADMQVRYDVIGIYEHDLIRHIENAFEYVE